MQSATLNQMFSKEYNSISDTYYASTESDVLSLKGCELRCRSLLAEPAIPRYYRIKTLLLLASMVADPNEALVFLGQADILLRVLRSYEVKGATSRPEIDPALNELEEIVVMLREILAQETAEGMSDGSVDDDSADDDSADPDGSEMQETAVKAITDEEAATEAAKKTKEKPQ